MNSLSFTFTLSKKKVVIVNDELGKMWSRIFLMCVCVCVCVHILYIYIYIFGDRGSTVVKVLYYKSDGRWFDPSWCQWNFIYIKSFRSH